MRKKYLTKDQQRSHVISQQSSGMSITAYCREHDINPKTFGNWNIKYGKQISKKEKLSLVPVKPGQPISLNNILRIIFPSGIILELNSQVDALAILKGLHEQGASS